MHQKHSGRSFIVAIMGLCTCLIVAQSSPAGASNGSKIAAQISITSPASGAKVSGTVSIVAQASSTTSWINFYIDGNWVASSPPYTDSWSSNTVANGSHLVSVKGFSSSGTLLATSTINVSVDNVKTTPTPAPTATPTPAPTPTPSPAAPAPTATPTPAPSPTPAPTGTSYYIDSNQTGYNGASTPTAGSECALANAGPGTSSGSPKCTLASVAAMQATLTSDNQVLFKRGDTWSEELTITKLQGTAGHPVVLGSYGSGALPIIDGGSSRSTCINAESTTAKYITIDGIECQNTTEYGITFQTTDGGMPGITVENSVIHNTGPGAYAGGSGAYDDDNYRNQLDFEDFGAGTGADGVSFLNNTVSNCGGHNCLEVHYDGGGPTVHGNIVGPGCVHNCIDVKGAIGATIDQNVATTGVTTGGQGCIYLENTYTASSSVLVTRNVCYGSGVGFQVDTGGACVGHTHCLQAITGYNNTMVAPADAAFAIIVGGSAGDIGDISVTWENNITDGGTVDINSAVVWMGDYNDDGGYQGQYATNVTPGSHDMSNVNPLYVNFTGDNFELQSTSPIADAGLPGLDNDMMSMGAYQ
jgi:hypothetical protein